MYDAFLFDLDGTLTDNSQGITNSVRHALKYYGIEAENKDLLGFIGPPLYESFEKYYGIKDGHKAVEHYREYYRDKGIFENRVYEGIPEALETLKKAGKKLYVATSKPEDFARAILDHFELSPYFEGIYGATMDSSRVAKPDIIAFLLQEHPDIQNPIMIGDREHDILGAKENEIASAGVLYGFGSREELENAGADYILARPENLPELLQD